MHGRTPGRERRGRRRGKKSQPPPSVTPLGVKHALAFQSIKHSTSFHD
jgi:hypothetical protein